LRENKKCLIVSAVIVIAIALAIFATIYVYKDTIWPKMPDVSDGPIPTTDDEPPPVNGGSHRGIWASNYNNDDTNLPKKADVSDGLMPTTDYPPPPVNGGNQNFPN